ncbi:hypothetical protein NMY22_g3259 [Coprinellus aureogranulatus]|nr:hypothetical protein NMY22_g3259 [Coprinellus aureogranulatus]
MPGPKRRRPLAQIRSLRCLVPTCPRAFDTEGGRTQHMRSKHADLSGHRQSRQPAVQRSPSPADPTADQETPALDFNFHPEDVPCTPEPNDLPNNTPQARPRKILHPYLTGDICDALGRPLPPGPRTPPPISERTNDDFTPFEDGTHFCIADFLYRREEMSQTNINTLLHLWGLTLMKHGATFGPFDNYTHLFNTIDNIEQGDAPWQCLQVELQEDIDDSSPSWKKKQYEV